jgi:hypothetical protein
LLSSASKKEGDPNASLPDPLESATNIEKGLPGRQTGSDRTEMQGFAKQELVSDPVRVASRFFHHVSYGACIKNQEEGGKR